MDPGPDCLPAFDFRKSSPYRKSVSDDLTLMSVQLM